MAWFVAATKPHAEATALGHLERQGFSVLLPYYSKTRRHARREDTVKKALFPGYIFINFDPNNTAWRCINGTIGVRHLLTNGGIPQAVLPSFMEELIDLIDDNGVVSIEERPFAKGDVIEVNQGPFTGQIAKIIDSSHQHRISILMSLMGRDVISTIEVDHIGLAS